METPEGPGTLIARCIVCRGNIFHGELYEVWEGGYYCQQHSLPWLRQRAREYAEMLRGEEMIGDRG